MKAKLTLSIAATLALHGAVTSTRRPGDEPEQRMIELP